MKLARPALGLLILAIALALAIVALKRHNAQVDRFVFWGVNGGVNFDAAIEREVVEVELAQSGQDLVLALCKELHAGQWRRTNQWQEKRAEVAALTLQTPEYRTNLNALPSLAQSVLLGVFVSYRTS